MMKIVGASVIIMASFVLGCSKRAAMVRSELALSSFIELIRFIRQRFESSSDSIVSAFLGPNAWNADEYTEFVSNAACSICEGAMLGDALCEKFKECELFLIAGPAERAEAISYLESVGQDTRERELEKSERIISFLTDSNKKRKELNDKRKSYYETVYTLCGAAIAIMLL